MSYARFGCDGSDVYVIGTHKGDEEVFYCCGCSLTPIILHPEGCQCRKGDLLDRLLGIEDGSRCFGFSYDGTHFSSPSRAAMIEHLKEHRAQGQTVPDYCLEALAKETEWGQP